MRRGFTLLELAMVLVVSGLMLGFGLQVTQSSNSAGCYVSTKTQVESIREAIERFARSNDRLPMPAARNVGVEDANYGREALAAAIDQAAGVSWGALPFQALGLSPSMGGDCWGNKFTYVVTTALTTNASSGGYLDSAVLGNITLKTSATTSTSTAIAYAVISHGDDQLGAVEINYSGVSKGWCTGTDIKHTNCTANAAVAAGAAFNDGKDAAANYFDDIVIAAQKPQVLNTAACTNCCWGGNTNGQVGDGTTTQRNKPTQITMPAGVNNFPTIARGPGHTCALGDNGLPYCWGDNGSGQLGDGTTTQRTVPTAVTLPVGVTSFTNISVGDNHTCGTGNNNTLYCWGNNSSDKMGDGSWASSLTAKPIPYPGGVTSVKELSLSSQNTCIIGNNGRVYCAGINTWGQIGDGTNTLADYLTAATLPVGVTSFRSLTTSMGNVCAIGNNGLPYCWGYNYYGRLGDGTNTDRAVPTPVSMPGGVTSFNSISAGGFNTCGIANTGTAYCWGYALYGQLGNGTAWWGGQYTPVAVTNPAGVTAFNFIAAARGWGDDGACGIGNDRKTYCWGFGADGRIGDGGTSIKLVPTAVTMTSGDTPFGSISGAACGVPLLTAAWGGNDIGQIGDETTTHRTAPTYVKQPSNAAYFTQIAGTSRDTPTRCALGNNGKAYCWGYNTCGAVGDGTRTNRNKPTEVALPAGVTSFKKIASSGRATCAIGNNDKLYCWGSENTCFGWASNTTPAEVVFPSGTVSDVQLPYYGGVLGTDGNVYEFTSNYAISSVALPGGITSAKALAYNGSSCIIGNDDWVYCRGCWGASEGDVNCTVGNGALPASNRSDAYTAVASPVLADRVTNAGVSSFKAISGGGFTCAIGNDDNIYCWGMCDDPGICGNGNEYMTQTKPMRVSLPTGVTGWKNVSVDNKLVTALGNDGYYYYWGCLYYESSAGFANCSKPPTRIPLPPGASGFSSVSALGRIAITR